jgi:hypothetical protein
VGTTVGKQISNNYLQITNFLAIVYVPTNEHNSLIISEMKMIFAVVGNNATSPWFGFFSQPHYILLLGNESFSDFIFYNINGF